MKQGQLIQVTWSKGEKYYSHYIAETEKYWIVSDWNTLEHPRSLEKTGKTIIAVEVVEIKE